MIFRASNKEMPENKIPEDKSAGNSNLNTLISVAANKKNGDSNEK